MSVEQCLMQIKTKIPKGYYVKDELFYAKLFWRIEMKCHKCQKVVLWEKMVTPDGRVYHIQCWTKFEEMEK